MRTADSRARPLEDRLDVRLENTRGIERRLAENLSGERGERRVVEREERRDASRVPVSTSISATIVASDVVRTSISTTTAFGSAALATTPTGRPAPQKVETSAGRRRGRSGVTRKTTFGGALTRASGKAATARSHASGAASSRSA